MAKVNTFLLNTCCQLNTGGHLSKFKLMSFVALPCHIHQNFVWWPIWVMSVTRGMHYFVYMYNTVKPV